MIQDKALAADGAATLKPITCSITTAVSQTAAVALGIIPGFVGEVVKVEVWASAVTATVSADVAIGSTTVLTGAVTPVAGAATSGTLVTSRASRRFSKTDQLNVKYTTNGSGVATNLKVTVWVRPYPLTGEA